MLSEIFSDLRLGLPSPFEQGRVSDYFVLGVFGKDEITYVRPVERLTPARNAETAEALENAAIMACGFEKYRGPSQMRNGSVDPAYSTSVSAQTRSQRKNPNTHHGGFGI